MSRERLKINEEKPEVREEKGISGFRKKTKCFA